MYGRLAVVGAVAAIIGGVSGIAAMSPYVAPPPDPARPAAEQQPSPDPGIVAEVPGVDGAVREVGGRVGDPACRAVNADGYAQRIPVAAQVSRVGVVVVDAFGNVVGSGACTVDRG